MKGFISLVLIITLIGFFAFFSSTKTILNEIENSNNAFLSISEMLSLKRFEIEINFDQQIEQTIRNAKIKYIALNSNEKQEAIKQEIIDKTWNIIKEYSAQKSPKIEFYVSQLQTNNYNEIYSSKSKMQLTKSALNEIFLVSIINVEQKEIITFSNTGAGIRKTIFAIISSNDQKNYFALPVKYEFTLSDWMNKGIASIEFLLVFAALASFIIVISEIQKNNLDLTKIEFNSLKDKTSALNCELIIDNAFANNSIDLPKCNINNNKAVLINEKKLAYLVNSKTTTVSSTENIFVAIEGMHYVN